MPEQEIALQFKMRLCEAEPEKHGWAPCAPNERNCIRCIERLQARIDTLKEVRKKSDKQTNNFYHLHMNIEDEITMEQARMADMMTAPPPGATSLCPDCGNLLVELEDAPGCFGCDCTLKEGNDGREKP